MNKRKEEEILNDIKYWENKLKEICGPSLFGMYAKYNKVYDDKGNVVELVLDPEVVKCYDEIEKLQQEYRNSGYVVHRGEYGGSSNGW